VSSATGSETPTPLEEIIGKWLYIERPSAVDGNKQTFFGRCEWASSDLLNFRLAGIGHLGLPLNGSGSFRVSEPTND
jgi:hypothetical protein